MGATLTFVEEETYEVIQCSACGVRFAVPQQFQKSLRETKRTFYCPNGDARVYRQSRADELEAQLQRERQQHDQTRADALHQRERRERAERQAAAARGQVTKIRKRAGKGVCPCCNRFFSDLHRHMQTKHPTWHQEEVPAEAQK